MGRGNQAGRLTVTVLKGEQLPNRSGMMDKTDPYVKLELYNAQWAQGAEVKTVVADNAGSNPEWGQALVMEKNADEDLLKIKVYDDDTFNDDKIGEAMLHLDPVAEGSEFYVNIFKDEEFRGRIFLKIDY
mmetsp:Transcript_6977/g.10978  ORF Transcript_6977/g.10978 Transcript_6977/m.10978 type:complete len:130 (+) Transcript_6977:3-392(+)